MNCQKNVIVRLAMTERCQKEFTGKNRNHNFIIYGGIFAALLGVLYLYRFHLVSIIVSYGLGCVACYYGLTTEVLRHYVEQFTCHFLQKSSEKEEIPKGCNTCGSKDCNRHDPQIYAEPWRGLQIHKQLDQAIEDFYNTILEQFINSWYTKITLQPFFVDELRHQLRYASASLLRRALKVDYAALILDRLVPCALQHYSVATSGARPRPHVAASNRAAELRYLRCVTDSLLPYLLGTNEVQNPVFRVLVREIFAGWVLLSLTDVLADPYILNTLIILATSNETMAQLPATPNYKVEFLETFVRQTESAYARRPRLLRAQLEPLVQDPGHLYALMQHLKAGGDIHVLHFYKDIKSFQTRILNPDLTAEEQAYLHREAKELYERYIDVSLPCVALPDALERELRDLLETGKDCVKRLQTSRALYQAAHQSHAMLEKVLMPKFLHSEEFYKLLIGPRVPTGYHKQFTKRPQDKPVKLGSRLRNALRSQTADGQALDSNGPDDEGLENVDILKYLDSLAAEDGLGDQDLSTYKVVLTNVETRLQPPPRRGPVRVFRAAVRCGPGVGPGVTGVTGVAGVAGRLWTVERTEHDFHLLRAKLQEFHGDRLLAHLPLPSRRDNSPLETLRYKYEDFLQRILQISLLQTSELLYLFLTVDTDFALVVQASTLSAGTDLGNIYQSVAHRLRKEKGQHLESFLRNFLISSDKERYQALKQGTAREVEEGQEVGEVVGAEGAAGGAGRPRGARDIRSRTFGDNWGEAPLLERRDSAPQPRLAGFTQCLMYILIKVIKPRSLVWGVLGRAAGRVAGAARGPLDGALRAALGRRLARLLGERRLAHLVRLGHGILFSKRSSPRTEAAQQRAAARERVRFWAGGAGGAGWGAAGWVGGAGGAGGAGWAALALGPGLRRAALAAFDVIQNPLLNKQLVYNLFDLCVMELFPELRSDAPS